MTTTDPFPVLAPTHQIPMEHRRNRPEISMTTVRLTVDPQQTPREEAELVARVAAAIAESTGSDNVVIELQRSEHVRVEGTSVADRMQGSARWSA